MTHLLFILFPFSIAEILTKDLVNVILNLVCPRGVQNCFIDCWIMVMVGIIHFTTSGRILRVHPISSQWVEWMDTIYVLNLAFKSKLVENRYVYHWKSMFLMCLILYQFELAICILMIITKNYYWFVKLLSLIHESRLFHKIFNKH